MTIRDKATLKSYFDTGDVPTSEQLKDLIDSIPEAGLENPLTSVGDLIVGGVSGVQERLPVGTVGKVLTSTGTTVNWQNPTDISNYLKLDASNGPLTADLDIHGVTIGRGPVVNPGNTKVGRHALDSLVLKGDFDNNGSFNSVFGEYSGESLTIGEKNSFFGYYSGMSMTDGKENLIMGTDAGMDALGDQNVILGASTDPVPNESNNSIVIGYNAKGLGSNTTVIGNANTVRTKLFGVLNLVLKTPASSTDTGVQGDACYDADYIYVCTATNTWKRSPLTSW